MRQISRLGIAIISTILLGLPSLAMARLENPQHYTQEPAAAPAVNLVLAFSQHLHLKDTVVEIRNSQGLRVSIGELRTRGNGTDLEIPLSAPLAPDTYTIRWRAVSTLGFVDEGGYDFTIDPKTRGIAAVAQQ